MIIINRATMLVLLIVHLINTFILFKVSLPSLEKQIKMGIFKATSQTLECILKVVFSRLNR